MYFYSMRFPLKLVKRLESRKSDNAFRQLPLPSSHVDFFSNDYLGFAKSREIYEKADLLLKTKVSNFNGATGSRLISGNDSLYNCAEEVIAQFHNASAALIFNSGYDANIGFFSAVPQRGDIIIYDELVHASIRDGIALSLAKSYKFCHNDCEGLKKLLDKFAGSKEDTEIYVVTESIFSMDGDMAPLLEIARICKVMGSRLVVDEAHTTGVIGKNGGGLVQELSLEKEVFARMHTFGKALGCHGAVVLGSNELREYLINFSRSFIYTTGLPPHSLATIIVVYEMLSGNREPLLKLHDNIELFKGTTSSIDLHGHFINSDSAIQSFLHPGNNRVKSIAKKLQAEGFEVKPILSPTVPKGKERLRFCLHSYNSEEEITSVLSLLVKFIE